MPRNVLYWSESQLSRKSANHPNCAFADSASTVMCGAMISLTPCIAAKVDRQVDLHEIAEFQDAEDMVQQLNVILSKAIGFPSIPTPRKDCHTMTFQPKKRHTQYVMFPEQDCESLVYMSDQNKSMIETLDIHEDPFWQERVEKFYGWFHKSSRTSKAAWTWEEGQDTSKWSGTRGSSKRHQSVPVNPADRPNPEEKSLDWRDIGDLNTSYDYLFPENPVEECPVPKVDQLETEQAAAVHEVDRENFRY